MVKDRWLKEKTITVHMAAHRLKYSDERIRQLINTGDLSGIKRNGRIFVFEASIDRFLDGKCEEV